MYLLLMRRGHENCLHISAHVKLSKKPVAFVKNEMLHFGKIEDLKNLDKKKEKKGEAEEGEGERGKADERDGERVSEIEKE